MKTILRFLVSVFSALLLLPGPGSFAADEALPAQPATLSERRSSLQNRIQFPDISGDVFVLVLCNAEISERGHLLGQVYCYRDPELESYVSPDITPARREPEVGPDVSVTEVTTRSFDWYEERFEREVVEASRNARMEPARLNGKRVKVKINFSVLFVQKDGVRNIDVFLHHFRNVSLLGLDYIAAQRFSAQNRMWDSSRPDDCPMLHIPIWISSIVMINGSAYNVALENAGRNSEVSTEAVDRCVDAYKTQVKENLFVPTMANNTYVNGFYTELFYDDLRNDNQEENFSMSEALESSFQNGGNRSMEFDDSKLKAIRSSFREFFGDRFRSP